MCVRHIRSSVLGLTVGGRPGLKTNAATEVFLLSSYIVNSILCKIQPFEIATFLLQDLPVNYSSTQTRITRLPFSLLDYLTTGHQVAWFVHIRLP